MSLRVSTSLLLLLSVTLGFGQRSPVLWNHRADRINAQDWTLTFRATLAPGWHIYSQYLKGDGPIPTSIMLDSGRECIALGKAEERGHAVAFYDSLYESEITWYAGEVSFLQKVRLFQPVPVIGGTIEFMACNEHQCIPCQEKFLIMINSSEKKP